MEKVFVCLANSRKISGRCIAGRELLDCDVGEWIRPVSERDSREISEEDRRYEDGSTAQVFDIIRVHMSGLDDHPFQEENYIIDDGLYWEKEGEYTGDLESLLDEPELLWENGNSSYNGFNDRVPTSSIDEKIQTLYFIFPDSFKIVVRTEGAEFGNGKKKVRADFTYNGERYFLAITDPDIEREYLAKGEGEYCLDEDVYLTVSLADSHNGYCYKLVAGVFSEE